MIKRYELIDPSTIKQKWLEHNEKFGVYVHSPFCASICKFCIYAGVNVSKHKNGYKDYYEKYLPKVIDFYRPILIHKNNLINNWFFGGGTPSLMSPETMDHLFESLPNFKDHPSEKTFEVHPGVFQIEQLDVLQKYNFNNIIICQQTLDKETLIKQKRVPSGIEELKLLTKECRKRNFNICFDIIGFLNEIDSDEDILENDLKQVYDIVTPDQISIQTLYQRIDLTEKVIRKIYDSDFIKNKEYLIEIFNPGINVNDVESVIDHNKKLKCFRLYKKEKSNDLNFNLISYMDPQWMNMTNSNTLAMGSFKNPSTQTHSNIGNFNYIECNYDNSDPKFKFVTNNNFTEEISFFTDIFNKIGNPPADMIFSIKNKFVMENEMCLFLQFNFEFDNNEVCHKEYINKFQKELEKEKHLIINRLKCSSIIQKVTFSYD